MRAAAAAPTRSATAGWPGAACLPRPPRSAPLPAKLTPAAAAPSPPSSAAADEQQQAGGEAGGLALSPDSWAIVQARQQTPQGTPPLQPPRVLVVDGTNLACRVAAGRPTAGARGAGASALPALQQRFAAWLQFLAAVAAGGGSASGACSLSPQQQQAGAEGQQPPLLVVVTFDNKGSSLTNVRAQLAPGYLAGRYAAGGANDVALTGWASELTGVVEALHQQHEHQLGQHQPGQQQHLGQQQQQPGQQQQQDHNEGPVPACCGFLPATAAFGFEADDVLAAAAAWCRSALQPPPHVIVASADRDCQQLLADGAVYWLELLQVPSVQHPSGLALHSAASFRQQHGGLEPAAYADFLALTGKREAGLPSVGLSSRLARTLLAKFGSLEGLLAARDALRPFGAAHKLLGAGQPGADARCATAATNLAVLRMRPGQQQLPEQQLRQCYAAGLALAAAQHQQQPSPQQQQQQHTAASTSLLHPARRRHMAEAAPYLAALQRSLLALGVPDHQQHVNYTSPSGLWCDLLLEVPAAAAAAGAGDQPGTSWAAACYILTPEELQQTAADGAGGVGRLAAECGCLADGTSALGHPKRALLRAATNGAQRHVALLSKGASGREGSRLPLLVLPFYELLQPDDGGGGDVSRRYVAAVLQEHCPGCLPNV